MTAHDAEGIEFDDYKDRYVAFLDLLGFKTQVDEAENSPEARVQLRRVLHIVRDTLCANPALDFRLSYFSDCLLLSAARTLDALGEMFASIEVLTFNLLQHDVFVRGGLTAGLAQHGKEFVFGSAINRAVTIEADIAKHPITLISEEVMGDARPHVKFFGPWIEQSDGGPFIHYLRRFAEYTHQPIYAGKVIMDDPAGRVIDFVVDRLNRHTGPPLRKAEWFRDYWNRTVASQSIFAAIDAASAHRYNSHGATQMVRRMYSPGAPKSAPPATPEAGQAPGPADTAE